MLSNPGFVGDFLRGIFTALDNLGYFFLGGIFNIFFSIASAELFQGEVFNTFFERIQLILGVFMVFRLSITLLQIIVNPDMYKDKQSGAASLVRRVAVMLILLSVIVPITIPEEATNENPLNEKIASNGILFGFLYQIQESIVENNILGQLILGIDTGESGTGLETGGMRNVGQVLTSQVAQSFVTPTLNEGYDTVSEENFEEAAACPDIVRPYYNPLVTSGAIMNHITETCDSNGEVYAFDYTILGGFIVSVVMTIIVIGFTLDIAVRSIKLGILRLIAPIPIISYISPGQEKDGAFGNWVKTLTSTYLSLFVRLVIIYFGIYLIIILRNGELINTDGLSVLAKIFVYIGILIFMKEAPKFFQDMLGLKGDGKLFSGIGTMLGAAALTGGLAGSAVTGIRAGWQEGQEYRDGATGRLSRFGRGALSVGRAALAGGAAGLGGAYVGAKTLATTDKKVPGAVYSAMQRNMARRAAHSTLFGRGWDKFSSAMTGSSPVDRMDAQIEGYKNASSLIDSIFAKADADSYWQYTYVDDDGIERSATVKALKKDYEILQNSDGVSPEALRAARDRYENAQEALVAAAITGQYTDGPFAEQIQRDYKNLRSIDRSRALKLFGKMDGYIDEGKTTDAVKAFKAAKYNASDEARNIQNTTKYSSRKANQTYSKQ